MQDLGRYVKQIVSKDFGIQGQLKLSNAKVLIIGAGGLGCPVLTSLNAMGVGTIGIIDFDVVSESNLHRQFLYNHDDIGKFKVDIIATRLTAQNPFTHVIPIREKLVASNALNFFINFDIIVDATDNFEARYMINDACVLLDKPQVYGSVYSWQGQVGVFNYHKDGYKTTYRDAFPNVPMPGEVLSCEEAGVLGIYPSLVGNFQANEVVKLIVGIGVPLVHSLLTMDFKSMQFYNIEVKPAGKDITLTHNEFLKKDYKLNCQI